VRRESAAGQAIHIQQPPALRQANGIPQNIDGCQHIERRIPDAVVEIQQRKAAAGAFFLFKKYFFAVEDIGGLRAEECGLLLNTAGGGEPPCCAEGRLPIEVDVLRFFDLCDAAAVPDSLPFDEGHEESLGGGTDHESVESASFSFDNLEFLIRFGEQYHENAIAIAHHPQGQVRGREKDFGVRGRCRAKDNVIGESIWNDDEIHRSISQIQ